MKPIAAPTNGINTKIYFVFSLLRSTFVFGLIEYIENGCKMKEEYSKRVDDFYFYTDKNNCERVYNAVKKIPLKD